MGLEKILISGAGIAGLSLARLFQQRNIPFTLIEKNANATTAGAGIALPANAVKALRYLGLGDTVEKSTHRVTDIIYTKPNGHILSKASLQKPPLNSDHFVALPRSRLQNILIEGLENQIHFDTTVKTLQQDNNGVMVEFNNAHTPKKHFSAVIGADGIHSTIRKLVFGKYDLVDLTVTNWRWSCDYATNNLQPTYMLGPKDAFMAYPISDKSVYCYAQIHDPNDILYKMNHHNTIKTQFGHYAGIAKTMLETLPETSIIIPGRLHSVPFPAFYQDNVALVGDASSACSPMLQQGAASAFEDVIALAELLTHFPIPTAFELYKQFREKRVTWVMQSSDNPLKAISYMNSSFALFSRNMLIRFKGPFNVQGWTTLLSEDPLAELPNFIQRYKDNNRPRP